MAWPGGQKFLHKLSEIFILGKKFSENFCPRIKIFRTFSCPSWTNFIWVGQKISEIFVLGQVLGQKIYPIGQKFSENFCPRIIFSREKFL